MGKQLVGERFVLTPEDAAYPEVFRVIPHPPKHLYGIGDPQAMKEGLAVVGARRATPYGLGCAKRFAGLAADRGIVIVSGGARGCDAASHRAALERGVPTVAFLGGGCDEVYPKENFGLFQEIIDCKGCVVSENVFSAPPLPHMFRERNRLIAGLAKATLIVEAGLPSGTFSTADEALAANREVLVVPGCITSEKSKGANRLIYQGAIPIVDDDSFADQLFSIFGELKQEDLRIHGEDMDAVCDVGTSGGFADDERQRAALQQAADAILAAMDAEPLGLEEIYVLANEASGRSDALTWLMVWLTKMQQCKRIARYPDGRYGPCP